MDNEVKSLRDAEKILETLWFPMRQNGFKIVENKLWNAKKYLENQRHNLNATAYADVFADPDEQAKQETLAGIVAGLESHAGGAE